MLIYDYHDVQDALEYACSRSLWGHGLMLASGMEEHYRTYVVNRFTASMMTSDPLNTYYTLMLGRTPSAVKVKRCIPNSHIRFNLQSYKITLIII